MELRVFRTQTGVFILRKQSHSDLIGSPQDLSGALADDDAWSHGVAGGHAQHNGPVRDAKVLDSIDPKPAIDDRHGRPVFAWRERVISGRRA